MRKLSRREFAQATIAALGCVGLTPISRMPVKLATEPRWYSASSNAIPEERTGPDERQNRTAAAAGSRRYNKKLRMPG